MRFVSIIIVFSLMSCTDPTAIHGMNTLLTDAPDWVDTVGIYQFTAVMNAQVLIEGMNIADCLGYANNICDDVGGDMLAAFDVGGNVRGMGIPMLIGFGDYQGQVIYETMLRSNADGDVLIFKYYDASEDDIYELKESYNFVNNDLVGTLVDPHTLSYFSLGVD